MQARAVLILAFKYNTCVKRAILLITLIVIVFGAWRISNYEDNKNVEPTNTVQSNTPEPFNKSQYPLDQPGSIWMIVNKQRALPADYVPEDLDVAEVTLRLNASNEQMRISKKALPAVEELFEAAKQAGHKLTFASGYRSYEYQKQLYTGYVAKDGQAAADRYSARPGTSEHQTGLALDVCETGSNCDLDTAFGATESGKWVAANAHNYGFIVRYAEGKEDITGYQYEPWHLRFVGKELANELHKTGQTMEEFFGI